MQRGLYAGGMMKRMVRSNGKPGRPIGGTIPARVKNGLLEPLEKIDLPEGKEIRIALLEAPTACAAGSWKGTVDADKLIADTYDVRQWFRQLDRFKSVFRKKKGRRPPTPRRAMFD